MTLERRMCWRCKRRTPEPPYKTCGVCRRERRTAMRAIRRERLRAGMCTRCGRRKPREGHTTCTRCAKLATEHAIEQQEARAIDGLCTRCGKYKPAKGRAWCKACLKRHRRSARKRTSSNSAARVARWKSKHRAAGRCIECGEPTDTNPVTRKPYARCELHRDAARGRRARSRDTDPVLES